MAKEMQSLNVELPPEMRTQFRNFCEDRGVKMKFAAAAAIRLFQVLPPDVRELLAMGNVSEAQKWIDDRREAFAEIAGLRAALGEAERWRNESPDAPARKARGKR